MKNKEQSGPLSLKGYQSKLDSAIKRGKQYGLKAVKTNRIYSGQKKPDHLADLTAVEVGQVIGFILEYYLKTLLEEVSDSNLEKVYYSAGYDFRADCGAILEIKSHRDEHQISDLSCQSCLYQVHGAEKQLNEMIRSGKYFMLAVFMYKSHPMYLVDNFSIFKYHSVQLFLGLGTHCTFLKLDGSEFKDFVSPDRSSLLKDKTLQKFIEDHLNDGAVEQVEKKTLKSEYPPRASAKSTHLSLIKRLRRLDRVNQSSRAGYLIDPKDKSSEVIDWIQMKYLLLSLALMRDGKTEEESNELVNDIYAESPKGWRNKPCSLALKSQSVLDVHNALSHMCNKLNIDIYKFIAIWVESNIEDPVWVAFEASIGVV